VRRPVSGSPDERHSRLRALIRPSSVLMRALRAARGRSGRGSLFVRPSTRPPLATSAICRPRCCGAPSRRGTAELALFSFVNLWSVHGRFFSTGGRCVANVFRGALERRRPDPLRWRALEEAPAPGRRPLHVVGAPRGPLAERALVSSLREDLGARRGVRSQIKTVPCIRIRRRLPYLAVVGSDAANRSDDPIAVVFATRLVSPHGTFRRVRRGGSGRPTKLSAVCGPLPPDGRPLAGAVAGRRRGDPQVVCEAPWREPTRQASPKDPRRSGSYDEHSARHW
jgi:hypothetical protein